MDQTRMLELLGSNVKLASVKANGLMTQILFSFVCWWLKSSFFSFTDVLMGLRNRYHVILKWKTQVKLHISLELRFWRSVHERYNLFHKSHTSTKSFNDWGYKIANSLILLFQKVKLKAKNCVLRLHSTRKGTNELDIYYVAGLVNRY